MSRVSRLISRRSSRKSCRFGPALLMPTKAAIAVNNKRPRKNNIRMFPVPPDLRIRSFTRLRLREFLGPPPKRQEERKRRVKAGVIFRGEPLTNPLDAGSPRGDEVFKNHLWWVALPQKAERGRR